MKTITAAAIAEAISRLCVKANIILRDDVLAGLKAALRRETSSRAKRILKAIIENAQIAGSKKLAICQDTGIACVFIELGQDVRIKGNLTQAINKGVVDGYQAGSFRNSIVFDPIRRSSGYYQPALVHVDIVPGTQLKLTVLPKGFGCENKSQLKMFNPTASRNEIKGFIISAVKNAGPDACPPYVIGVGIGGTADYAMLLAKKSLLRKLNTHDSRRNTEMNKFESDILRSINKLNIGPMGLGGKTTALAVHIETYPTHIAGLPVAVNISCHALRSATVIL